MRMLWAAVPAMIAVLLVAVAPGAIASADNGAGQGRSFVLVEENTEASSVIGNTTQFPTLNTLANQFGLATNYFGTTHPSEPNYASLVGGNDHGIRDDAAYQAHQIAQPSIADQLEQAHLTWKGYFEGLLPEYMPVAGFAGRPAARPRWPTWSPIPR
jgi:hypothetical protein